MAIQDVAVVSVPVSDQERAKAFYVETLGFEFISEDDSSPDFHWVRVAPKGADYEELVAKGVNFDGPPEPQPYAALETVLRDPDANGLVVQQA